MKRNTFIEGAFIATFGIFFVKIIGLLYVIPFQALVGENGGALYGYAYNIYALFLSISSAGFPFAVAKIVSEYSALGKHKSADKAYEVSKKSILAFSIISFLILFIFAPNFAKLIIGNAGTPQVLNDISFVIRIVSLSILVIPHLSITKGFLQGHRFIKPRTTSQIIEQIVRIIVILLGAFLCLKVFDLGLTNAIGVAVFGSFVGGLVALFYLQRKVKRVKSESLINYDESEKVESTKKILKKILSYSVPFIIINAAYNLYTNVDMVLVSRTLLDLLKYDLDKVESILSIYTTWGEKLNMIVLAISSGVIVSLIPNIVKAYTNKDMNDVNNKFNRALQCVIFISLPITIFLSLLVEPVWTLFYGSSYYGPLVFKVFVFTGFFNSLYNIVMNSLQGLSKYKLVLISVGLGLVLNATLDIPLMLLANSLGFEPYYGASIATILGYSLSLFIALKILNKKYHFDYTSTKKKLFDLVYSIGLFIIVIQGLKLFIPTNITSRLMQIPILGTYGIVSFGIYFLVLYLNGILGNIFGKRFQRKK